MRRLTPAAIAVAFLALAAAGWALSGLLSAEAGLRTEAASVGETPVTVWRPAEAGPAPAVVVAHGFAGSRPLMRAFATTLARNGLIAVTFDFLGHGRHPLPLTGDVTAEEGAERNLVEQTAEIVAFARDLEGADGRVALLGHSMAASVIARTAIEAAEVETVAAISMFARAVTATEPESMLVVAGEWEAFLVEEARRVVRLFAGGDAELGVTYGDPGEGPARRGAVARNVEHIGVLYSPDAMVEARDWMAAVFARPHADYADARGPYVLTLIFAAAALGWPASKLLPQVVTPPRGAGLRGRAFLRTALPPAIATPLILTTFDVGVLPVIVGDYFAQHFLLYGALTGLLLLRETWDRPEGPRARAGLLAAAAAAVAAWGLIAIGRPIDAYVSNFTPTAARAPLMLVMLCGTLPYFMADEWLTRGPGAPRWSYAATKLLFLASLALAIALDLSGLFFLIIMAPALALFFLVFGLISGWAYRATGHPFVGAFANALVFALAIAVTFPMVAG